MSWKKTMKSAQRLRDLASPLRGSLSTWTLVFSRPRSSLIGLLPTDTRTLSKTRAFSGERSPSKLTRTPFLVPFASLTRVFSRISSKAGSRRLVRGRTRSGSTPGRSPPVISTTVTFVPTGTRSNTAACVLSAVMLNERPPVPNRRSPVQRPSMADRRGYERPQAHVPAASPGPEPAAHVPRSSVA